MKHIMSIIFVLTMAACSNIDLDVELECKIHSDCQTPMEYLVQSNCPFASACIENECKVICPFTYHDPNPNISKSYPLACNKNSDCDCSDRINSIDCICLDNGCVSVEGNIEVNQIKEETNKFDDPPKIYNIGINLDKWNKETNMAGDVLFKKYQYDEKLFIEYGATKGGKNVHPEFYLPVGSKVMSSTNGIIIAITYIEQTKDYAVLINRGKEDKFTINHEHVVNVTVNVGDIVKTGDIIGEVSPRHDGFGLTAIMIFTSIADNKDHMTYCPYDLLDESVKETYENKIMQLVKDWEEFTNEDIYDEETWFSPGCKYKMFLESEAMVNSDS